MGSDNGLLPDGTTHLPEPMLIYFQLDPEHASMDFFVKIRTFQVKQIQFGMSSALC